MVLGTPITCLAEAGGAKRDAGSNHAFLGPDLKPWQHVCVISFSVSICWKIECLVLSSYLQEVHVLALRGSRGQSHIGNRQCIHIYVYINILTHICFRTSFFLWGYTLSKVMS